MVNTPIDYIGHAKQRMRQRGVAEIHVQQAIRVGTRKRSRRPGPERYRYEKGIGNRRVVVIVEEEETVFRVVTAFWK